MGNSYDRIFGDRSYKERIAELETKLAAYQMDYADLHSEMLAREQDWLSQVLTLGERIQALEMELSLARDRAENTTTTNTTTMNAISTYEDLFGADFQHARLWRANFHNADLSNSDIVPPKLIPPKPNPIDEMANRVIPFQGKKISIFYHEQGMVRFQLGRIVKLVAISHDTATIEWLPKGCKKTVFLSLKESFGIGVEWVDPVKFSTTKMASDRSFSSAYSWTELQFKRLGAACSEVHWFKFQ